MNSLSGAKGLGFQQDNLSHNSGLGVAAGPMLPFVKCGGLHAVGRVWVDSLGHFKWQFVWKCLLRSKVANSRALSRVGQGGEGQGRDITRSTYLRH